MPIGRHGTPGVNSWLRASAAVIRADQRAARAEAFDRGMLGRVFGRWTVLKKDNDTYRHWICQCTCAAKTKRSVALDSLQRGLSSSCGCARLTPEHTARAKAAWTPERRAKASARSVAALASPEIRERISEAARAGIVAVQLQHAFYRTPPARSKAAPVQGEER